MKYFAYGSNMLEERLRATNRVPDAIFLTVGRVQGYKLQFHKRSVDQSGKCNIIRANFLMDVLYGVVFEVSDDQLAALDSAEGFGRGYHHTLDIPVQFSDGTEIPVLAYVADSSAVDDSLHPYQWYHELVIAGAEQHSLPDDYITGLRTISSVQDPDPNRRTKREAETALNKYYSQKHV